MNERIKRKNETFIRNKLLKGPILQLYVLASNSKRQNLYAFGHMGFVCLAVIFVY